MPNGCCPKRPVDLIFVKALVFDRYTGATIIAAEAGAGGAAK